MGKKIKTTFQGKLLVGCYRRLQLLTDDLAELNGILQSLSTVLISL